jgi:Tol biopolymer transport system component/predicted Ser/Thr protein kinase
MATASVPRRTISHYELLDQLGSGGMGVVYKARDLTLDRFVALKILPAEFAVNGDRRARFIREAKAASALNHPGIVTVHEINTETDPPFIVLEYVDGKPLSEILRARRLKLPESLEIALEICEALRVAHAAGIVHRDLKPANIMVASSGRVKLLDFGLAKMVISRSAAAEDSTRTLEAATEEGSILGTASYMSPEQAQAASVDRRSDIFSFGAVLYEMITGRRAFEGKNTISTIAAIVHQDPRPVRELAVECPAELERIVARCLKKDPARRFQDADDLAVALAEVREELLSSAAPVVGVARKHLGRSALFAAASLFVIGATVAGWLALRPRPTAPIVLTPLTSYPGSEQHPTFSPDGTQVAFSWDGERQDNFDIYVVLASGGPPRRLTMAPSPDTAPAWSPDGRQIAFIRNPGPNGAVFLTSALGGGETKLGDTPGMSVCWTPDGKWVGKASPPSSSQGQAITLVSVVTGEQRAVTHARAHESDDQCAISPDGKQIAFSRDTSAYEDVYLASLDRNDERALTVEQPDVAGLAWTPDGSEVIASLIRPGSWNSRLVRLSVRHSARPSPLDWAEDATNPSFSQNPSSPPFRLVYQKSITDSNLWVYDLARNEAALAGLRGRIVAPSTRREGTPQFSPDGEKVAFESDRSGHLSVYVAAADGANVLELTPNLGCTAGGPRWSRDGSMLAFDCYQKTKDIYTIPAAGGPARRLAADGAAPSWSGDGRWIYFASGRSGRAEVWKVAPNGGDAVQVTFAGGLEAFESLDGRSLYYTKEKPGLWTMPLSGGSEAQLLSSVETYRWALTEKGIYFADPNRLPASNYVVTSSQACNVNFYDFKTRRTSTVLRLERGLVSESGALTVTSDGRKLLAVQLDNAGSDLMLVDSFPGRK